MKFLNFFSNTAILFFILITILFGIIERKNILELFFEGAIEGEKIVISLFPTLLALIVAVGMLNKSGIIYFISNLMEPIFNFFKIEKALVPLILLRQKNLLKAGGTLVGMTSLLIIEKILYRI